MDKKITTVLILSLLSFSLSGSPMNYLHLYYSELKEPVFVPGYRYVMTLDEDKKMIKQFKYFGDRNNRGTINKYCVNDTSRARIVSLIEKHTSIVDGQYRLCFNDNEINSLDSQIINFCYYLNRIVVNGDVWSFYWYNANPFSYMRPKEQVICIFYANSSTPQYLYGLVLGGKVSAHGNELSFVYKEDYIAFIYDDEEVFRLPSDTSSPVAFWNTYH
ncbi:MAG: hypothetical protein IJT26_04135 [Bacteroidales bacterium]|nr:hypothetical protein [Bacteroidales bacterium]